MVLLSPEVTEVLADQNPWHRLGTVPDKLAPRDERFLARHLWKALGDGQPVRYQFVLGPRRVGKTTVMYQTIRRLLEAGVEPSRLWWIRLDHPGLMTTRLDDLLRHAIVQARATEADPAYLFLDELVYAEHWDRWLKSFHDDRWPVRIVASSSATAALRQRNVESGVGRWEEQPLLPLGVTEALHLATDEVPATCPLPLAEAHLVSANRSALRLREFLALTGGFPELLWPAVQAIAADADAMRDALLDSQRRLREDAIERAVYKDIPQSFGVNEPMKLERLLYALAGQVSELVSAERLGRDLGLSQPTIDTYLAYLQRAFLIFLLPNYSGSAASQARRGRKVYFVDGGVRNAALQRGIRVLTDPADAGHLLENLVASHLHTLAMLTPGTHLHHWRDGDLEVDLVFDDPDEPMAIEVASSGRHSVAGLRAFVERFPRFRDKAWLAAPGVTPIPPSRSTDGIGRLDVDVLLSAVGASIEQATARRFGAGRSE